MCNKLGPPGPIPDFHVPVSRKDFLFPPDGTVRWRVEFCSAVLRVGWTGREAATVAMERCIVFCCVEGGMDRKGSSNCGGGELH